MNPKSVIHNGGTMTQVENEDRQWDEYCVYCGNTKGAHFGPPSDPDPVCYQGNPFGRRFMGSGEFANE